MVDVFFFFKQNTAYEMRISDWSSDVCSSDLVNRYGNVLRGLDVRAGEKVLWVGENSWEVVAVNHAARKVGAVCVPMNYRLAPDEAAYVIDNCDAETGSAPCRERVCQSVSC